VHDCVMLFASIRHGGLSLLHVARAELGRTPGWLVAVFVLFLLILAMAGASIAVVNALQGSAWGVFTVGATIPISILVGAYLRWIRPGRVAEATAIGLALVVGAVVGGHSIEATALGAALRMSHEALCTAVPIYAFFATLLPVWLLLVPRDYLSSYVKVGTMVVLVAGVVVANPILRMPAFTQYVHGGGPVIPGTVWPFLFIVISCGAVSGYHSIVCCGTTPKMLRTEPDVRVVAYAAALLESVVAISALIAVTVLAPSDYFAINATPEAFAQLGIQPENLALMSRQVGEDLVGRPGGAAVLAAGMAKLLGAALGGEALMKYWYHFAIVFQALFILTLIDAGTRAGRYLLQEIGGEIWPALRTGKQWGGVLVTSVLVCAAWGYLLHGGSIAQIWPLFGANNQLLGAIAFAIGTTMLLRAGKRRYVWATVAPMCFLAVTALAGAYLNVVQSYLPAHNWLLVILSSALAALGVVVLAVACAQWPRVWRAGVSTCAAPQAAVGEPTP
jgi:carbon starvation protein